MDLLRLIYLVANAMAGIAMAGTLFAMIVHLARARRERRVSVVRRRMSAEIMRNLQNPETGDATVALMRRHPALAVELLQEMTELITGAQRDLLLTFARSAGLDRWLMKELHSWRFYRRLAAVETLGRFATPEAIAALTAALDDPAPDVRIGAALALVNLGAAPSIPTLVDKLDIQSRYRPLVLRRLFLKIAPSRFEDMFAIAEGQLGAALLRPYAIEALGATGHIEFADRLAPLMDDPDPRIRAAMLGAIGLLGLGPERDVVAEGLDDKAWEVRAQAIQTVRQLDRFDLAPRIAALAQDDSWWVRLHASECLTAISDAGLERMRSLIAASERPPSEAQRGAEPDESPPPLRAAERGAAQ